MSCKKKQHSYITGQSTHHHTNKPMNRNKSTQQSTPPTTTTWERRSKQATDTSAVVTDAVPRRGVTHCRNKEMAL
jgi:hypothetical protein